MGKTRPVQSSFSTGSISPSMLLRSDLEGYSDAVLTMENFEATLAGPAISRDGFENINSFATASGTYGRIFPFNVSSSRSFLVWIGTSDADIQIFDRNGRFGDFNLVSNGDFEDDGTDWVVGGSGGSAEFFDGLAYLDGGIEDTDDVSITGIFNVPGGNIANEHSITVRSLSGQNMNITVHNGTTNVLNADVSGVNSKLTFTPGNTVLTVILTVDGDQVGNKEIDFVQIRDTTIAVTGIDFTSPYTNQKWIEDIHAEMAPDVDTMYFTAHDVQPYKLEYDRDANTFAWSLVVFTVQDEVPNPIPVPWASSAPASCTFHDGRLWLAGSREFPNRIWASDPDDYEVFTYTVADAEADDAIDFNLKRRGAIKWIESVKDLQVSTGETNNTLFSDGPVLTAVDAEVKQQSVYGASRVKGLGLSDGVVWVAPSSKRVFFSQYSDELQGYKPTDISFQAEHLTGVGLVECYVKKTPDQRLMFLGADGDLLGCTFEPSRKTLGWYRYKTEGEVVSFCVSEEFGESVIYWLVRRVTGATVQLVLERQIADLHLDNGIHRVFGADQSSIDDLPIPDGQEVQIRVDGAMQLNQTVASGSITLDPPGKDICIGLPYIGTVETLPIEFIADGQGSPSLKKRYSKIFVRLNASYIPIINGENPRLRNPATPMDTPEGAITGDVEVANLGWSDLGTVTVTMELPYRTEMLGIFGELAMTGL